jgi:hypothetical protein
MSPLSRMGLEVAQAISGARATGPRSLPDVTGSVWR